MTEGTRPSQPGTLLKQHIGEGPPGSYRLLGRRDPVCALSRNSVFESESRRHLLDGASGTRSTESGTPGVGHVPGGNRRPSQVKSRLEPGKLGWGELLHCADESKGCGLCDLVVLGISSTIGALRGGRIEEAGYRDVGIDGTGK